MSSTRSLPRGRGQRAGLDRDQVLDAARRTLHAGGLSGVSIRSVAAEAGVAPNAIYSYYPSKSALIDALLDDALGEVPLPAESCSPMDGLDAIFTDSYDVLVRQPDLVPSYLARQGSRGPNAQRLGERTLELLDAAGVDQDAARTALRVLIIQAIGFAAFAVGVSDGASTPGPRSAESRRDEFRRSLDWLLKGIRAHE